MNITYRKTDPVSLARWSKSSISHALVNIIVCAADIVTILGTSFASGILYHLAVYGQVGNFDHYFSIGFLIALLFGVLAAYQREYTMERCQGLQTINLRLIQNWTISFAIMIVLGFLTKSTAVYSRGWLLLFYFTGLILITLNRYAIRQLINLAIAKGMISIQRIIIVGFPENVNLLLNMMAKTRSRIEILNVVHLPTATQIDHALNSVIRSARILGPDSIYLAVPLQNSQLISKCIDMFTTLPLSVYLVSGGILSRFRRIEVAKIGDVVSLRVLQPPLTLMSLALKRVFDFTVAAILLLLLAPVMVAAMVAIRIESPGPVLYRQSRFGFTQRPFHILKFRTMKVSEEGDSIVQALKNDKRITKVGNFLRRTNIDELPQLFNVLTGQMSLVGPRPHALIHDHDFERRIAAYAHRQKVKPGITGWAQVNGLRGPTDTDEKIIRRVEYDIFYIENWSLLLDLRILIYTVFSKKAYENAG